MEEIIQPIDKELLKKELSKDRFIRNTRKGGNEIYIVNQHNAPNTLLEIGRLREITFRSSGGGTGKSYDLDELDTNEICYEQLIVWCPEEQEIVGGYRFILCANAIKDGKLHLSTSNYFDFKEHFINDYLPYTIELGRSWVQPNYQPSVDPRKGLFALDNIWDGLGALIVHYPKMKYFFGKVTMYPTFNEDARNYLLNFLNHYFPDKELLLRPLHPLHVPLNETFKVDVAEDLNFKDAFKRLNSYVREKGENIPPLVNIYMNLSPTMRTFGTAVNHEFGNVEETGIMVTIADIYPEKKERHIESFNKADN